jgi:hypothetical protein
MLKTLNGFLINVRVEMLVLDGLDYLEFVVRETH